MPTFDRLTSGTEFTDETFEGLELEHADLSGREFFRCTFRALKAPESSWARSRLEECVFESCDLSRANLTEARFIDVAFRDTRLMGTDWSAVAPNPDVRFDACDLRFASFVKTNLRKTKLRACKASEANFIECELVEADLGGTDLTGANIDACDLSKADLSTAIGAFLNPANNRVKGARISVESAVLLAMSFGMKVGDEAEPERRGRRR